MRVTVLPSRAGERPRAPQLVVPRGAHTDEDHDCYDDDEEEEEGEEDHIQVNSGGRGKRGRGKRGRTKKNEGSATAVFTPQQLECMKRLQAAFASQDVLEDHVR